MHYWELYTISAGLALIQLYAIHFIAAMMTSQGFWESISTKDHFSSIAMAIIPGVNLLFVLTAGAAYLFYYFQARLTAAYVAVTVLYIGELLLLAQAALH